MVSSNPLFSGSYGGFMQKFDATVINDIWPEVFFFSAVSASEHLPPISIHRRVFTNVFVCDFVQWYAV
jgi:hypothetical protein